MTEVKRPKNSQSGISSATLVGLVENTAPFLFALDVKNPSLAYVQILKDAKTEPPAEVDLWNYFDLCLAAHFATVGTFVPTDVDVAIRQKLWANVHHEIAFEPIWKRILEFHDWDESPVSRRFVRTISGKKLSGHQGEWFTVAMGAYGAALKSAPEFLSEVREAIEAEFKNQKLALTELYSAFDEAPSVASMKDLLAGIAAVAHNLGDLDRMFDTWDIPDTDVLKRRVYRSGHEDARAPQTVFLKSGKLYQELLAAENHRHFALREPKGLRKCSEFLLPYGPFMDAWGAQFFKNTQAGEPSSEAERLTEGERREIAEALILGWKRLNPVSIYTSQGYARALTGMAQALGDQALPWQMTAMRLKAGREKLVDLVPPALKKELNESGLRTLMAIPQGDYEKKWLSRLKNP